MRSLGVVTLIRFCYSDLALASSVSEKRFTRFRLRSEFIEFVEEFVGGRRRADDAVVTTKKLSFYNFVRGFLLCLFSSS